MKAALWCLVSIGMLPCIYIAFGGMIYRQHLIMQQRLQSMYPGRILHDQYFRIHWGYLKVDLYPRLWAFALLTAGIIAVIASLVVLLHCPLGDTNGQLTSGPIPPRSPSDME